MSSDMKRKYTDGGSRDRLQWKRYEDTAHSGRNGVRKARAQLELTLAKE